MCYIEKVDILCDLLRQSNRCVTSFVFNLFGYEYIVIFEVYDNKNKVSNKKYIKAIITFYDSLNEKKPLKSGFNKNGFQNISVSEIYDFFRVSYNSNGIGFFEYFKMVFNEAMPEKININYTERQKELICATIDSRTTENKGKICFALKRLPIDENGRQQCRSAENNTKAEVFAFDLYCDFKNDIHISFCFTNDESKKRSPNEIRKAFENK